MTHSTSTRKFSVALFVLVPLAYLSMALWRPADSFGAFGRTGISPFGASLMAAVFLVSLLSWTRHRVVAALGFIACVLWLAVTLLPVL